LHQQIMRGAILNQELATASLPRHMGILKQQYGAMAGPVLAEAVSGRAWGLVQVFPSFFLLLCLFFMPWALCRLCISTSAAPSFSFSRLAPPLGLGFRSEVWSGFRSVVPPRGVLVVLVLRLARTLETKRRDYLTSYHSAVA